MISKAQLWFQFAEEAFKDNKEWSMWLGLLWWAEESQND